MQHVAPLYIQTPPHVHIFINQIESLWEAERKQAKPSVVKVMLKMVQDQLAWGWTLGGLDGLITCVGRQVCSAVQNTPCPATPPDRPTGSRTVRACAPRSLVAVLAAVVAAGVLAQQSQTSDSNFSTQTGEFRYMQSYVVRAAGGARSGPMGKAKRGHRVLSRSGGRLP